MKKYTFTLKVIAILLAITFSSSYAGQPKQESFSFVQLCDPQLGYGSSYQQDVNSFKTAVKLINELKPDFVFICGDMVQTFDEKSLKDFNDIRAGLKVPSYCCPGNHDIGNEPNATSLGKYRSVFGKDYFSFEYKGFTFVVTNTGLWKVTVEKESQKHDTWFKQTLEAARDKKSPVFFIGHHPLYTKTPDEPNGYNPLPVAKRKELLDLFEKCGVVAALTAHTHQFISNDYKGIQMITGETTSKNSDRRPFGFRLWHVESPASIKQEFVPLTAATTAAASQNTPRMP
jgi:serine/threonine-protein phosphatase CPPED1